MLFDLVFMALLLPAAIYHKVNAFYAAVGMCNGSSGYAFELFVIGPTFAMVLVAIEIVFYSGLDYIRTFVIEKNFGFSKVTED